MTNSIPAKRLRMARERAGFKTASEAARALGVPVSTYICYEDGLRGFHRHARKFAVRFKVPFNWLLGGPGEPTDISADLLADLSPEAQVAALAYIEFLKSKERK